MCQAKVAEFMQQLTESGVLSKVLRKDLAHLSVVPRLSDAPRVYALLQEAIKTYNLQEKDRKSQPCLICTCTLQNPVKLPHCLECNQKSVSEDLRKISPLKKYSTQLLLCKDCADSYLELKKPANQRKATVRHLICSNVYMPASLTPDTAYQIA